MATRLYFYRSTAFDPQPNNFTPVVEGSWNSDFSEIYCLAPTGYHSSDGSYLTRGVNTNSSAATLCHAIAYSPPMSGSYTWDFNEFLDFNIRIDEEFTSMNVFTQWYFGVISNDGSTVHIMTSAMKDNTEASTTLCARINQDGYSMTPSSYQSVPGDRLFVEVGWDKDGSVSGLINMQYGHIAGDSDLSTGTDCTTNNPYVNLSTTVSFDAEGTVYDERKSRLMLMGVG